MSGASRYGLVDLGSNAIRVMVVEVAGSEPAVLESHRLPIRLGRYVFTTGGIPEALVSEVVDAMRRFRAACDRHGVERIRAIATAAVREANNRDALIDRVREACGIDVEVISGTQEAYLLARAVQETLDLGQGRSLLADLGGGSVEIVLVENGRVVSADSYPLGSLRILRSIPQVDDGTAFVELLERHLHGLERRVAARLGTGRIDRYAATGGNIESLADVLQQGSRAIAMSDLQRLVVELARCSVDERIAKGLKPDRADTILAAGVVYAWLGRIAGVDRVLVPRVGIRNGMLREIVEGHVDAFSAVDHEEVALASCRALAQKYRCEMEHAESVCALAWQIFDQTTELHGLDRRARVLLGAAALLHDIGAVVKNSGHHKHSYYLIRNSEMVGFAEQERELVALVARYHRRAPPGREHPEFVALRRKDRLLVERLAALLRIADALDLQHAGVIRSVAVHCGAEAVALRPVQDPRQQSALTLEQRALEEKGRMFAALFGRPVTLVTG